MAEPKIDTDWNGNALDLSVAGGVVSMRRHGSDVAFAVVGRDVVTLSAQDCDDIACALASAAELARRDAVSGGTPEPTDG